MFVNGDLICMGYSPTDYAIYSLKSRAAVDVATPAHAAATASGLGGMGMGAAYQMPTNMTSTTVDKGKGKSREIDFEAAFAEVQQSLGPSEAETARIVELDDTDNLEDALKGVTLEDMTDESGTMKSSFQS